MAPENTVHQAPRPAQPSGQTIVVPRPEAGAELSVPSSPSGVLEFAFDPQQATFSREDFNLVFQVDGGGRVVIQDYFIVGDESLPDLKIPADADNPEGTTVASADFFEGSGLDMSTAAGAPAAPPSGGSDGSGADLLMTSGIDKLGDQGTWFWGYEREVEDEMIGIDYPGGGFGVGVITDLGPVLGSVSYVYEDAQPFQHRDGEQPAPTHAGEIVMAFQPNAVSTVGAVTIWNLPEGAQLWLGDPANGGTLLTPNSLGQYVFAEGNFDGTLPAVYVVPPRDDDADFNLDVSVQFVGGGTSVTVTGILPVTVDAVADKPFDVGLEESDTSYQMSQAHSQEEEKPSTDERGKVDLRVEAAFSDVQDGSESHYIVLENIPSDWLLNAIPNGWGAVVQVLVNGVYTSYTLDEFNAQFCQIGQNGYNTIRFDVTDAAEQSGGPVSADVSFDPRDWTSSGSTEEGQGGRWSDGTPNNDSTDGVTIVVRAVAVDTEQDGWLDQSNNTAETEHSFTVSIVEDTPDFVNTSKGEDGEDIVTKVSVDEAAGVLSPDVAYDDLKEAESVHAALENSGAATPGAPLGVSQGKVTFNLYSDGPNDGAASGHKDSEPNLEWDLDAIKGLELFAKLQGEISSAEGASAEGYAPLQFELGENGQLIGFFIDNANNKVVALVGVLTTNYETGEAVVTFAQYAALQHPDADQRNSLSENFAVKLTDDDGDVTYGTVQFTSKDDIAAAVDDSGYRYDERQHSSLSDNVLTNDSSGSDGWVNDGQGNVGGVVEYTMSGLPTGYTVSYPGENGAVSVPVTGGVTGDLAVGTTYTITSAGGTPVGTFVLNADGDWVFTGGNVLKDFELKVNYTAEDADGDQAKATLTIDVEASPLVVNLTGTTLVAESANAGNLAHPAVADGKDMPGHEHGVATYNMTLHDWNNGNAVGGEAVSEAVTAKIKVAFGDAERADFNLLKDPSGTYVEYSYKIDGVLSSAKAYISAYGSPVEGFTFTVTLPEGVDAGGLTFKLPITDDAYGGKTGASGQDTLTEGYTVSVESVTSASDSAQLPADAIKDGCTTANDLHSSQGTTILDDSARWNGSDWEYAANNRLDGADPYVHGNDPHRLDGPMFKLAGAAASVTEGNSVNYTLGGTLSPETGAAYPDGSNASEPIVLTFSFTLTGGASMADISSVSGLTATGASYEFYNNSTGTWQTLTSSSLTKANAYDNGVAQIRVKLGTNFDLNDLGKVGLKVTAFNDNLGESGEGYSLSITGTSGMESTYHGNPVTTTVSDDNKNYVSISDADRVWEGDTLQYTITFGTKATITATNTDTVTLTLQFGGSEANGATWGADYDLGAIIKANDSRLVFKTVGGAVIDPEKPETWPADGKVVVEIPSSAWKVDTSSPDSPDGYFENTLVLKVPTTHDNQLYENDEDVTITITQASGAEIAAGASGIKNATGTGEIEDRGALTLTPVGNTDLQEDQTNAGPEKTIATYQVNFTYDDGNPAAGFTYVTQATDAANFSNVYAATEFTFDITLKNVSKDIFFDKDTFNNDPANADTDKAGNYSEAAKDAFGTDAALGDYGWAIDGEPVVYRNLGTPEGKADLAAAINKYLSDTYGENSAGQQYVSVASISDDGMTITFKVLPGADLSTAMQIQVTSIEDRITEGTEKFEVVLNNIHSTDYDEADHENLVIEAPNKAEGTIIDDHNKDSRDGFLVGINPGSDNESAKLIELPIVLFERGDDGKTADVNPNNPPSQSITVKLDVGAKGDTATLNADYYVNADGTYSVTIPPYYYVSDTDNNLPKDYNGAYWKFVDDGATDHWEAVNVGIPLNDDRLTEGEESFTVKLTEVSGHESSVLDGKDSATLTIIDDSLNKPEGMGEDPRQGTAWKDGPRLESFVLNGKLVEPEATDEHGDGKAPMVGGETRVDIDGFAPVPKDTSTITIDGLTFTSVTADGGDQGVNKGTGDTKLAATGDSLGVTSSSHSDGEAGGSEAILITNTTGGAISDFTFTVTNTSWTGSIFYQIFNDNGDAVGGQMQRSVGTGASLPITIADLPAGYSVMVYSQGASTWYLSGVEGTVTDGTIVPGEPQEISFTENAYTIALDAVAAEDIIVTLSLNDFNAEAGKDYELGDGIMTYAQLVEHYKGEGNIPSYFVKGGADSLYVVITAESDHAEYTVKILHDHDNTGKAGGLDGGNEALQFTIENMVGSEVQWGTYTDGEGNVHDVYTEEQLTAGKNDILDDGKGPIVEIQSASVDFGGAEAVISLTVGLEQQVAMGESVTVTIVAIGADNKVYTFEAAAEIGPDGKSASITIPASDWPDGLAGQPFFYLQLGGSHGGETQRDTSLTEPFYNLTGGSGGEYDNIIIAKVEGSSIGEQTNTAGVPQTTTYTITTDKIGHWNPETDVTFTISAVHNTTGDSDFVNDSLDGLTVTLDGQFLAGKENESLTIKVGPGSGDDKFTVNINGTNYDAVWNDATQQYDITGSGNTVIGQLSGDLPSAFDDAVIEGSEHFTPIITGGSGHVYPEKVAPGQVEVVDNDAPTVKVSFGYEDTDGFHTVTNVTEGEMAHASGNNYVVRVELTNGTDQLTLDADASPVTVELVFSGTASINGDVTVFTTTVTLYPGDKLSDVRVTFPDDFISDNGVNFKVDAYILDEAGNRQTSVTDFGNTGLAGSITVDADLAGGVTITDLVNGPKLALSSDVKSVGEDGTAGFYVTLDKVLEEKATVTLKIDLENVASTAQGFTLEDIGYIYVNGAYYAVNADGTFDKVTFNDEGEVDSRTPYTGDHVSLVDDDILVNLEMDSGSSKDGFKVILNNDKISEGTENLNVSVVSTEKGELLVPVYNDKGVLTGYADGSGIGSVDEVSGYDAEGNPTTWPNGKDFGLPSVNVKVTDVPDGPAFALKPGSASGVEGESVEIGITLTGKTVSETTVVLKLGDGVAENVIQPMGQDIDGNGTPDYYYVKVVDTASGAEYQGIVDKAAGTVTITLPKDVAGPLTVTFPLQDNAKEADNLNFSVSLDAEGIIGGEASLASAKTYEAEFVRESNTSITFTLEGEAASVDGNGVITLGNIPGGAEGYKNIAYITVNGVQYTVDADHYDAATGTWKVELNGKYASLNGATVTVVFGGDLVKAENQADLGSTKLGMSVSGTVSGQEISLTVADDGLNNWDGPVFSVAAGADITDEAGGTTTFAIKPNAKDGFETAEEAITVTFTVAGDNVNTVALSPALSSELYTLTGPVKGVYTLTIGKGADLNADIPVVVTSKADTYLGQNDGIKLTLTNADGGESTLSSNKAAEVAITGEASTAELVLAQGAAQVVEGNALSFSMQLKNNVTGAIMTSAVPIKVTLQVDAPEGSLEEDADRVTWNSDGKYYVVNVSLAAGATAQTVNLFTMTDLDDPRNVTITVVNVGDSSYITDNSPDTLHFTITDPAPDYSIIDMGSLPGNPADFDGSLLNGYGKGLTVTGTEADNEITGSGNYGDTISAGAGNDRIYGLGGNDNLDGGAGNDIIDGGLGNDLIIGGAGNDTLTGNLGDDIFEWAAADTVTADGATGPATDVITDFSMTAATDATKSGSAGNDAINLKDLLPDATRETLDDYLEIVKSEDGVSAELHISTEPGGEVNQVIVLQNVYSDHAVEGNTDAVDSLILQHILTHNS